MAADYLTVARQAMYEGDLDMAIAAFCLAIQDRQNLPEALNGLGLALLNQKKWLEAETCLQKSVELAPDRVEGYNNLALLFLETKRLHEAVQCLRMALRQEPDCAALHNNLGLALEELLKPEVAEMHYREAIRWQVTYAEAHYNLGNLLKSQLRLTEAEACLREAIVLRPEYDQAIFSLSVLQLMQGRFEEGWPNYDVWRMKQPTRRAESRRWQGESLQKKSILLFYEQGFGDTIQFVRYVPLVVAQAERVVVWIQSSLADVFVASDFGAQLYLGEEPPTETFDFACPIPSLPIVFASNAQTFPNKIPYLRTDQALIGKWRKRLNIGLSPRRLQIGIVWAGNSNHHNDRNRSVPVSLFAPLFVCPDVDWHSLQVGKRSGDVAALGACVQDWESELIDFSQTAAALANLDLLISVDSSVAHLAGAIGIPVWLLVPFLPDWRWALAREDSYWYSSMRLFRQGQPGDWLSVLQRVKLALTEKVVKTIDKC